MRKILVTGASGFVGRKLFDMAARGEADRTINLVALPERVDLRHPQSVKDGLGDASYDGVVHLAAVAFVPDSFARPQETYDVNLHGTINLIDALREKDFSGSFLYVSSGDVYGSVREDALPIRENLLPRPRNPYAASKLAAEAYCYQAALSFGFRVVIARPFNHIGPGQSDRFVLPAMAKQIFEIKKGIRPSVIETGNMDVTRDFSDVRDVVRAYLRLLASQVSGEIYNVCSGVEYNVGSVLLRMLELAGVQAEIKVMEQKVRPNEQVRHCGSNEKLRGDTGWTPTVPFDRALYDLLSSWQIVQ